MPSLFHLRRAQRLARTALALGLLVLVGCGRAPGRVAQHGGPPQKIVVMAPAAAEMLAELSALDRVVGIGDFVLWPPAVTGLPRVGAYDAPNVEQLLALGTDLVISTASHAASPAHRGLEQLGIEVLALNTSTFDGVFSSLAEVGVVLHKEAEAAALADEIRERLRSIRERAQGL